MNQQNLIFDYQRTPRFFAQISDGMEEFGAEELSELGAKDIHPAYRGIYFNADKATLYRINYCSRLIARVLAPLYSFQCHSERYLYRRAGEIYWPDLLKSHLSFAVSANVSNSNIKNSQYAGLRLKDAIVDRYRDAGLERPNVDRLQPDVRLNLHIERNKGTISFDTSGDSMHRRGYRKETVEAPMQEILAAVIIRLTAWDGSKPLHDPMCGSGTLLSEALMKYCRIPSGFLRKRFGFEFLPDFDRGLWERVKADADAQMRPLPEGLIAGSDASPEAVRAAKTNLAALPCGDRIELKVAPFQELAELKDRVIVCNPPYGIRIGKHPDLVKLFKAFGDFLKQRCTGSTAYLYFGKRDMIGHIGLKPSMKKPLSSGGLDGRLTRFEMY